MSTEAFKTVSDLQYIQEKIPHRSPFLWVDRIIDRAPDQLTTEKFIPEDLDIFEGHYPGYPILPGVILCEALFQSGALLIAESMGQEPVGAPVVTRILKAKFKREVKPGDTIQMQVTLKEKVGPAWFLKGKVLVNSKIAVSLEFGCTLKT